MRGVWQLLYSCWGSLFLTGLILAIGTRILAGEPLNAPRQSPISESDVSPHSRPLTHAQLLDEYLARLQEQLKLETRSIEESGLVEVKLTIRKDGSVTFAEIVVLDGPATLRNDLLPLVNQLGPFPPPPIEADILTVSMLLPLRYPGPDLLDSIDQAP
jgi:outer membrane biosynthesis protein TonB